MIINQVPMLTIKKMRTSLEAIRSASFNPKDNPEGSLNLIDDRQRDSKEVEPEIENIKATASY